MCNEVPRGRTHDIRNGTGGGGKHRHGSCRGGPAQLAVRWTQATAAGLANFADIGLVRGTNGVLHVIWTNGKTGSFAAYDARGLPWWPAP